MSAAESLGGEVLDYLRSLGIWQVEIEPPSGTLATNRVEAAAAR